MDADVEALVKAIEDSFGVNFDEGELTDESGLECVHRALNARLGGGASGGCFASVTFWRLRRAFVEVLSIPRNSLKPSTVLESVIPTVGRRQNWRTLSETVDLRLPALEYPDHVARGIGWASIWSSILLGLLAVGWGSVWWFLAAAVGFPFAVAFFFFALTPLACAFPSHTRTVGDLTRTVVGLNHARLTRELGPSAERELSDALRHVIADVTGIEPTLLMGENPRLLDLVLANDGLRASV